MAGSQKNRPVDPDVEDNTTFEDNHLSGSASGGGIEPPRNPWYAPGEESITPEERQFGKITKDSEVVSVANDNVAKNLRYTMQVDGIPVTNMNDEQIYRCIEELARFMDKPLKLHDPKPEGIPLDSVNPDYALLLNHGDRNSRTVLHEMLDHVVRGAMTRADVGDISIARIK